MYNVLICVPMYVSAHKALLIYVHIMYVHTYTCICKCVKYVHMCVPRDIHNLHTHMQACNPDIHTHVRTYVCEHVRTGFTDVTKNTHYAIYVVHTHVRTYILKYSA